MKNEWTLFNNHAHEMSSFESTIEALDALDDLGEGWIYSHKFNTVIWHSDFEAYKEIKQEVGL